VFPAGEDCFVEGPVRYAKNGEINLAYRIVGDGPANLLFVPTWTSNLDLIDDYPPIVRYLERISSFTRLIVLDRRGTGLSDRTYGVATLEEGMDDLLAVLDHAEIDRAAVAGLGESGPLCALLAATHPGRISGLILYGSFATTLRADDYPWAPTPEEREMQVAFMTEFWGREEFANLMSPESALDPAFMRWAGRWMRGSITKDALPAAFDILARTDVRHVLPTIRVPTLLLHRSGDAVVPVDNSRYMASKIPNSKLVEFPGSDALPFLGDWDPIADEIEEFLTGARLKREMDRVLATIMFTDIVGSSNKAGELGDRRWKELLDEHDRIIAFEVDNHGGRLVKNTGDGALATFDGPARAIRAACRIRNKVKDIGLETRAGLHTGEVELRGDDLGGIAVHIGARVSEQAGAGQVLVSGSVPPLVAGSGIDFVDLGERALKGIQGDWRLYEVKS
jgi:class 3 adenylate cyclase/pimeloyl-ACP methyl ester carboxylesterase